MMRFTRLLTGGKHRLVGLALLVPMLVSCNGSATGPGKGWIGAEGGTASLNGGKVVLSVLSGAVSTGIEFTATQASPGTASDLIVPGSTYDIGPLETTFARLATLTLSYDPQNLPEGVQEDELRLFKLVGEDWELMVNSSVDTDAHTVTGKIESLGRFGARGLSVQSVELSLDFYSLEKGHAKRLEAVGRGPFGQLIPGRPVEWTSGNEDAATVDEDGLVTAVGVGSAIIKATIEGDSAMANILTWSCSSQPEIPAEECDALVTVYESVTEADWRYSNVWVPTPNPCGWLGVTCKDGSVSELNLPFRKLTGSLPYSLGKLTDLKVLNLSSNQLTGQIPSSLEDLQSLVDLNLAINLLTGTIPPELGELSNLKWMNLSFNQLTGEIPPEFENLSDLERVILSHNQLTGAIPSGLGSLSNLLEVTLSGNELTGSIPSEFGNLADLSGLDLGFNQLTGSIPPELGALSSLLNLSLGSNQLTGPIPPEFGALSSLLSLSLRSNKLTGSIPSELGGLSKLEEIILSENQLSGLLPLSIAQLGGLIQANQSGVSCSFVPQGTNSLSMPDTQDYRAADLNGDGSICGVNIGSGLPVPE